MGYLVKIPIFGPTSTVLAVEVKVYWGQALFFKPYVLFNNFRRTIGPRAVCVTPLCFCRSNRVTPNLAPKNNLKI